MKQDVNDLKEIPALMAFIEDAMRGIVAQADTPDFDVAPCYFAIVEPTPTEKETKVFIISPVGLQKYEARDKIKMALRNFGKYCNIVGYVDTVWINVKGEGVMVKVETRAGPSHLKIINLLRHENAPPTLGDDHIDAYDPDPPLGAMGNLFEVERTNPLPQKVADHLNTGGNNGNPQSTHKPH